MTKPDVAPRHDEVTLRYPVTMLPRSRALSDLILEPGPTPERLDLGLRRVLAHRIAASAPARSWGALRLDSYSILAALDERPREQRAFSWSPRATKRILGVRAAHRVLSGQCATPTEAVCAEIDDVIKRTEQQHTRPGSLGSWLEESTLGVRAAVIGEAVAHATDIITLLEWESVREITTIGRADPVWAVPGAPWISLRGRRDLEVTLDDERQERALVALRPGRPNPHSIDDLSLVALVEGLSQPEKPLPTRIVGVWPASGKSISLEVTRSTTQHAARFVVDAISKMREMVGHKSAA